MKPALNFKSLNVPRPNLAPLRISDILLAADDDDVLDELSIMSESECSRSICCPSPHRIVARWISGLRRTRVKRIPGEHVKKEKETESKMDEDEKGLGDRAVQARCSMNGLKGLGEHVKKEKEIESKMDEGEKGLGDRAVQARCSMNGLNGLGEHVKKEKETESKMDEDEKGLGDRAVQARCSMNGLKGGNSVSTTGESRKDTSFNMGVGCCLLYLIAASKNELNKIVQMRLQMETLLQNTSEELINKSNISKLSKPNDMFACSDTDSPQGPQFESQYIP
ncbi:uncharacterized protein LOC122724023 isoform X2 [Manihot esculenta]|uniref:uncharacterized protein LOC122724023 isoform X2 n=1 Tax=Manihot esculenta TaxID=3983 RepID=UPI001CC6A094|nr:uncharacterized protein LOC122724023 isoform X2 [Manihot esculenta]